MQERKKYIVSEDGMSIISHAGNKLKYRIRDGKYVVSFNAYGKIKTYSVARIVYNYYNPEWDINSKELIGFKDGNGLNPHKDNLIPVGRTMIREHKLNPEQEKLVKKLHIEDKISIRRLSEQFQISKNLVIKLIKK